MDAQSNKQRNELKYAGVNISLSENCSLPRGAGGHGVEIFLTIGGGGMPN